MLRGTTLQTTLLLVCMFGTVLAQEFRATLTGRLTDASGAGVPNANVTAKNVQTNAEARATTGEDGNYTIPFLQPGTYEVSAEGAGFKRSVRENIVLQVGGSTTVDFNLQVGDVAEQVTVTGDAPLLEASTATRGGVIENLRVTELPLNGRNPFMLSNLTPGVVFGGNQQFTRPFDNGDNARFSINGGVRQSNEFVIDGAPDNAVSDTEGNRSRANQNVAYIPTVDTTQEFKVITNFYDAQYGRTGGGIISVSTKAGTNEYHGTVYDFLRRYQWDANNIAANAVGRPIYAVEPGTGRNLGGRKLDQYGFYVGGPATIPKLYNAKDKTFFSFGWEDYRESTPSPGLGSVPTVAERNGDFSGAGITVYDPFSTRLNPAFNSSQPVSINNPQYIRDQFPNNVIPLNRQDPVGRALAGSFPEPNNGTGRFNNFLSSPNLSRDRFKNWLARVDHNVGQKVRLFGRYAWNKREQFDQGTLALPGIFLDAQDPLIRENNNAVFDAVTVLSPSMILDTRVALTRYIEEAQRRSVFGFDATSVGFPASFSAARPDPIPPRLSIEQYGDVGTRNQRYNVSNVVSFQPMLSWIRGKHSLKFGGDLRDIRVNTASGSFVWGGGMFSFNRDFTTQFPGIQQNNSGSAIASLLLGAPTGGTIQNTPRLAYRWGYYGWFIQDDFRVTPRLTLNLGLRWDMEGSATERYNRMNRGWNFEAADPRLAAAARTANAADCPACANLTGGLLFANENGQPREAFNTDYDHWQPRIGAAYQLTDRTVLRGGFGIYYLPQAFFGGVQGFAIDTPFVSTVGGGERAFIPANTLSNPFPGGLLSPTGSAAGLGTFAGQGAIFVNPDRRIPRANQWSFGIQHQLPWSVKVDASYVGSRSYDINTGDNQTGSARNINANTAAQIERFRQDANYFNQAVPNPFAGLLPGTSLNAPTVTRQQLLRPYPQFTDVTFVGESVGKIWYDALQLSVEKRYTQGLVMVLAYTWSKNLESVGFLNPQDVEPTKTVTAVDRPHRLVLSGVYELPFGRGRSIGRDVGRGVNMLIAGWEYNFIGTIQSGTPVDLPGNVDIIGPVSSEDGTFSNWFNGCVAPISGNATCSDPAWRLRNTSNTLRTTPFRAGWIRNPTRPQWDMSLNKKVYFTESLNFQFRFEAFNVFNTPVRSGPVTDPTRADFGTVPLGQSNIPRQVQLGFKFNF
jgi:hypothetical protein